MFSASGSRNPRASSFVRIPAPGIVIAVLLEKQAGQLDADLIVVRNQFERFDIFGLGRRRILGSELAGFENQKLGWRRLKFRATIV